MFKRELLKIGVSGLIGLIVGGVYAMSNSAWIFSLIGPFYAIGIFYGGKYLILGAGKVVGAWFTGVFRGGLMGFVMKTIFMLVGICALLFLGWIVGCVMAGKAAYQAKGQDMALGLGGKRSIGSNIPGNPGSRAPAAIGTNDFETWGGNNTLNSGSGGTSPGSLPAGSPMDSGDDGFDF